MAAKRFDPPPNSAVARGLHSLNASRAARFNQ